MKRTDICPSGCIPSLPTTETDPCCTFIISKKLSYSFVNHPGPTFYSNPVSNLSPVGSASSEQLRCPPRPYSPKYWPRWPKKQPNLAREYESITDHSRPNLALTISLYPSRPNKEELMQLLQISTYPMCFFTWTVETVLWLPHIYWMIRQVHDYVKFKHQINFFSRPRKTASYSPYPNGTGPALLSDSV